MTRTCWILATTSIAVLTLAAAPQANAQTAAAEASGNPPSVNEVVVTASRRAERLQDVPSEVTAITGTKLQDIGVLDFHDYASLVPGVSQRPFGAPGLGSIILRGLNSGALQTTNTAAYYIDDTPFTTSSFGGAGARVTPAPELAEIDHIEILEGPQGTLYGASSLGGLIRVVTKKPNLETYSATVSAEYDQIDNGGNGGYFRGSANMPLVQDKLAIMVNAYGRYSPGFTNNVATDSKNVNWSELGGGRAALRWKPLDNLTVDVSALYQAIYNNAYSYVTFIPGSLRPQYGNYNYNNFQNFGSVLHYDLYNLDAAYDTPFGTASWTLSQGDYHVEYSNDVTGQYVPLARGAAGAAATLKYYGQSINTVLPANSLASYQLHPNVGKTTSEFKFTSKRLADRIEFIAGAFYTHEYYESYSYITGYTPQDVMLPHSTINYQDNTSHYAELAGYANVTLYLLDNLDITGGVRYSSERESDTTLGPHGITYYAPSLGVNATSVNNPTTYLATMRYRLTSNFSTYVRYATGYRPGGPQTASILPPGAQTTILPDTTVNYEGGVKGTFWDGRVSIDASVYHIDWNNIQLSSSINGVIVQGNGGQAQVDGAEFQGQLRPIQGMIVTGDVGFNNGRITLISAQTSASLGAHLGDNLPLTPRYTAGGTVDQSFPLMGGKYEGTVGGTLRFSADNPSNYPGVTPVGERYLPAYTTLDLRAGIRYHQYAFQFRVENISNAVAYTTALSTLSVAGQGVVIRPRMFAFNVSASF